MVWKREATEKAFWSKLSTCSTIPDWIPIIGIADGIAILIFK